jgi:hypothetical protein
MLLRHSGGSGGSREGGWRWVGRRGTCVQTGHNPPTMVKAGGSRPSEFRMVSLKSIVLSMTRHSGAPQGFGRSEDVDVPAQHVGLTDAVAQVLHRRVMRRRHRRPDAAPSLRGSLRARRHLLSLWAARPERTACCNPTCETAARPAFDAKRGLWRSGIVETSVHPDARQRSRASLAMRADRLLAGPLRPTNPAGA